MPSTAVRCFSGGPEGRQKVAHGASRGRTPDLLLRFFPGLTPWATFYRPYGLESKLRSWAPMRHRQPPFYVIWTKAWATVSS